MSYEISEEAQEQLIEIQVQGLLLFGESQSRLYHDGLTHTFRLLAFQPHMGRKIGEEESKRVFSYGVHLIFYQLLDGEIRISRIIDSRSDYLLDNF